MRKTIIGVLVAAALIVTVTITLIRIPDTDIALRHQKDAVRKVAIGEVTAIREKANRYLNADSALEELQASTPMLTSIAETWPSDY